MAARAALATTLSATQGVQSVLDVISGRTRTRRERATAKRDLIDRSLRKGSEEGVSAHGSHGAEGCRRGHDRRIAERVSNCGKIRNPGNARKSLVPKVGLEPTLYFYKQILSLPRLPVSPFRHGPAIMRESVDLVEPQLCSLRRYQSSPSGLNTAHWVIRPE